MDKATEETLLNYYNAFDKRTEDGHATKTAIETTLSILCIFVKGINFEE